MHGLRTSHVNKSKECSKTQSLTHCHDVRLREIHLSIVGGRPLETNINPGFKSWMVLYDSTTVFVSFYAFRFASLCSLMYLYYYVFTSRIRPY